MPTREQQIQQVIDSGIVAVVRLDSSEHLLKAAEAIRAGGVRVIEFTMTTPGALDTLAQARKQLPSDVLLGAGTVLDPETARACILAGAEFTVSPSLNPKVIEMCHRYSKVCIPGALTPTEILTAWECGADIVKVFPASLGGPGYFKDLAGPFPHIRLMPTGGVNMETASAFIKAGACALGVGGNLVNSKACREGRFAEMTETAKKLIEIVRQARG